MANSAWLSWWPTPLGRSWLLDALPLGAGAARLGGVLWLVAGLGLIAAGLGLVGVPLLHGEWQTSALIGAALSLVALVLYFHPYYHGLLIARTQFGDGFRTIAVSRFGYLGTPLPADPSPAAQADAYAALLDALGIQREPSLAPPPAGPVRSILPCGIPTALLRSCCCPPPVLGTRPLPRGR